MRKLVIVTHPTMKESRLNAYLMQAISNEPDITIHELYKEYPDESIDVKREQLLLEEHDRIVFQFPNYWYSYPPLLKKWFDMVLQRGWAFSGGAALRGKEFGIAISSNYTAEEYRFDGMHRHTIEEIMAPFYATCNFIGTRSLPIFKTFNDSMITEKDLEKQSKRYLNYIRKTYTFHYDHGKQNSTK
jgi:glutathione-regulated potassium-efflux system ancillary protein KefG